MPQQYQYPQPGPPQLQHGYSQQHTFPPQSAFPQPYSQQFEGGPAEPGGPNTRYEVTYVPVMGPPIVVDAPKSQNPGRAKKPAKVMRR